MKKKKVNLRYAERKAVALYGPLPTEDQLMRGFPLEIERLIYARIGAFVAGYQYAKQQRKSK